MDFGKDCVAVLPKKVWKLLGPRPASNNKGDVRDWQITSFIIKGKMII